MKDPKSFVQDRDKRTDKALVLQRHKDVRVLIIVGSKTGTTYPGQVMAMTLANLLPRIFNNIGVVCPHIQLFPKLSLLQKKTLQEEIELLIQNINPAATLLDNSGAFDLVIGIGNDSIEKGYQTPDVIIDADGWIGMINPQEDWKMNHTSENIVGAVFAACIGVAELIKRSEQYSDKLYITQKIISLFDYQLHDYTDELLKQNNDFTSSMDLGKMLMVGAGAVGSSFAYLLYLMDAAFQIDIIDNDTVSISNLSKAPLYLPDHYLETMHKASVLSTWLHNGEGKIARAHVMKYSEYSSQNKRQPGQFDIVLPLADVVVENGITENARLQLQQGYLPLMMHGTTTADWGINFHRHIPFLDDCLMCRFPVERFSAKFTCGEAIAVDKTIEEDHIALPFQPLASATLLMAELIKLASGYPISNINKVYIDTKGPMESIILSRELPKQICLHHNKVKDIHKKWNEDSKYDFLIPIS